MSIQGRQGWWFNNNYTADHRIHRISYFSVSKAFADKWATIIRHRINDLHMDIAELKENRYIHSYNESIKREEENNRLLHLLTGGREGSLDKYEERSKLQ